MGSFSIGHWLVVLAIVAIVFGAGRLPKAMGDLAKGIRSFRDGLRDENPAKTAGEILPEPQPVERDRG